MYAFLFYNTLHHVFRMHVTPPYPSLPAYCPFSLFRAYVIRARVNKAVGKKWGSNKWTESRRETHTERKRALIVWVGKKNFIIVPSNRDREHTLGRRGCSGKICLLRRRRRLSTHTEVLRKTHLTFFVSKEIIQLVMQHWDRKSQNNGKSFSPQRHPWIRTDHSETWRF